MKTKLTLSLLFVVSVFMLNAQTSNRISGKAKMLSYIQQDFVQPLHVDGTDDYFDGFETYPDFNMSFSPWTTVDLDNFPTYGIENTEFPNQYAQMAFMIFNPSATTPPMTASAILPLSGSKFAACFASDGGANNDWLISPQIVLGSSSSVSFWVKSYTAEYGLERYKVGVSTTNTNPSSFTIISGANYLTAPATAWELKTFDINAYNGQSVYIGIQCISDDAFIFMVDDFEVITSSQASLPVLTTNGITGITATTAISGGNVTSDGGASVTARGIVWSTNANPTITSNMGMTNNGNGTGSFVSNLTGLTANTPYYVKAYATNSVGTAYGNQLNFTTGQGGGGDDWNATTITLYNTSEAAIMHRTGDIDNLGFGWPSGFDPFTGQNTPVHGFPFYPESEDPDGTDRIMVISGYTYQGGTADGYTSTTTRPGNMPLPVKLQFDLQSHTIQSVVLQMFVDDFQPGNFGPNYFQVSIDGVRVQFLESIINSLNQTGPIGKMISVQIPVSFLYLFEDGEVDILIDDPVNNVGDGYALDFIRILINPTNLLNTGTISGVVTDESGSPIAGANVTAGGIVSATTNSSGIYQLQNVPAGLTYVAASKSGYTTVSYMVDLIAGTISTRDFILPDDEGTGTLTGMVTDALNGNPIEGALVSVAGLSATTNASGNYTINNIPTGALSAAFNASTTQGEAPLTVNFFDQSGDGTSSVTCAKTGYITYINNQVVIEQGQSLTLNISLSQTLGEGALRFVINWGASPSDLDSHLNTPEIEGQVFHIYYSDQGSATEAPYAALDHDVVTGYGPETMTIYQMFPGTYQYYIYNFSGSPDMTTSNAVIQIYNQTGLIQTMQIPTTGTGRYWYVCDVNGSNGQLTYKNVIQETAPGNLKFNMPEKKTEEARNITSWMWNFGDGTTSTVQNPTKVYNSPGNYTVSLTVGNGVTTATETKTGYITVTGTGSGTGTLTGMVTDALNGNPVEGALVSVAGLSATTNASGNYTIINIPVGVLVSNFIANTTQGLAPLTVNFTDQSAENANIVTCSKEGYLTYSNSQVVIPQDGSLTLNISLSSQLTTGEMRFILNWGLNPDDLDSHLNTPAINGQSYHIYFSDQGSIDSPPYAALDHDVTDSYGPETMTIYEMYPGTYQYYIYNYSGSPEITTSQAVVQVYNQSGLLNTLQVPTSGSGLYWYICDIDGATGHITIRNVIQESAPGTFKYDMPVKIPTGNENITSWLWNFGDGGTSTQQNPSHVYNAVGNYTVSLTVGDGITQATETKIAYIQVSAIGLDEFDMFDLIQLYPQPAENELTIESPFKIERMSILDLSGREIAGLQRVDNTILRLSTSDFGKGVYLLYLETVNGTVVKKFTIK